ncbi:PREDICTED: protein AUXIN RESPONSE 4 [Nicotiana attenuata]|uniref:Protein auxin response 4 n=1 Tax=Nicotiana attenuata TaxID=49451 RepID=A0A314L3P5_NICAT|nr:PREDICTED: protein AUXIN RESPONSE 4 [Nicotiana attenuata]OIT35807.1 protein auxin response 4 [Nicotiana attenuata]
MAIITEEPDSPTPQKNQKPLKKPNSKPPQSTSPNPTKPTKTTNATTNPLHFWFYFTISVSLITLIFMTLTSLYPQDLKTWFLSLPPNLRQHYSKGQNIKVQITPNQPQVEVFTIQEGPSKSSDHVLIVHGLGCSSFGFQKVVNFLGVRGVHAVAIDLPGSGFSDKTIVVEEESVGGGGVLERFRDMYSEIQEKGIFWGFDQLVEQGYVNYEENNKIRVSKRNVVKAIDLGPEEMGKVLGQVIDSMGLSPVDLILHDSALGLSANWVSENRGLLRSVVVLDSATSGTALPLWVLEMPVVRDVVLGFGFAFRRLLGTCCSRSVGDLEAEGHRILLKGRDGRRAVVGMGKNLNCSFDLNEWAALDGVKGLPMQVIWSDALSKEWTKEGRQVADAIPQAKFVTHSGGRWPQEHNSEEIAESIYQFVSSLPKSVKQTEEEPVPEHIQKMFDEAQSGDQHHHHGHDGHGHGHEHGHSHGHAHAGYMDAYGLGQGWAM